MTRSDKPSGPRMGHDPLGPKGLSAQKLTSSFGLLHGRVFSFNDVVGSKQELLRYFQADGLGSLEIDRQVELGRLLDREVRRLTAFKDLIDHGGTLLAQEVVIGAIGQQQTSLHSLDIRTYGRKSFFDGLLRKVLRGRDDRGIRRNKESISQFMRDEKELFPYLFSIHPPDLELDKHKTHSLGCLPRRDHVGLVTRALWVIEEDHTSNLRAELF